MKNLMMILIIVAGFKAHSEEYKARFFVAGETMTTEEQKEFDSKMLVLVQSNCNLEYAANKAADGPERIELQHKLGEGSKLYSKVMDQPFNIMYFCHTHKDEYMH